MPTLLVKHCGVCNRRHATQEVTEKVLRLKRPLKAHSGGKKFSVKWMLGSHSIHFLANIYPPQLDRDFTFSAGCCAPLGGAPVAGWALGWGFDISPRLGSYKKCWARKRSFENDLSVLVFRSRKCKYCINNNSSSCEFNHKFCPSNAVVCWFS